VEKWKNNNPFFADVEAEKETEKKKLPMGASGCEMMMPHSP
jgi:hypothetical protein